MRISLLFLTFIYCLPSSGQVRTMDLEYNNGRKMATGKVFTCKEFNNKYPCTDSTCRKTGKWTYYYQNGKIERKERYSKIRNCNSEEIRTGFWEYYDEKGQLLRKDEYKDNILLNSDVAEYFVNTELAGKIIIRNGVRDTIEFISSNSNNLVKNGDFSLYYGPPDLVITNGQNQIEKQVPFWYSTDNHTPDYYNAFRRLKNVPDNIITIKPESNEYVGMILYHDPTSDYSEYITGELKSRLTPGTEYCLKVIIRLSMNSGYTVNHLGLVFSENKISIKPDDKNSVLLPDVMFNVLMDNRDDWDTLCTNFVAKGFEKFITIGRMAEIDHTTLIRREPINTSEGDFNESAYYLIDKIEVFESQECKCNWENGAGNERTL